MAGGSAGGVSNQQAQNRPPVAFGAGAQDGSNTMNGVPAGAPPMTMGANGIPQFGGVDPATVGPVVNSGVMVPVDRATATLPPGMNGMGKLDAAGGSPKMVPITQFQSLPQSTYFSDRTAYNEMVDQLQQSGLLPSSKKGKKPSLGSVTTAWNNLLVGASYNPQYTPAQFLQLAASTAMFKDIDGTQTGPKPAYDGPVAATNITNAFDAKALVNNALQQYLGRTATDAEIKAFHAQLNDTEAANPTVRTPHGHDYTTSGGAGNGAQEAVDFARSRGDYAETQAGAVGLNWLRDSVMNMQQNRMI